MIFSSITFISFFLPVVLLVYFCLPKLPAKNLWLFFSSLFFYAWGEPLYIFLMLASICFNYLSGLAIASASVVDKARSKKILALAVAVNVAVLFVFKYLGFASAIVNSFLSAVKLPLLNQINLILPIGISFYTFQEISYLADVYRDPKIVQKKIVNLGLYVTFFPQLIAGPIVRYTDINEQIEKRSSSLEMFALGAERFCFGLGKKVLLANQFAFVCDKIYDFAPRNYLGPYLTWIACAAYTLQIYFDFSGYSDMAIGLSKMFGFKLNENFNYPYIADSITDFWRRWHISLSSWFRDYVYIPLGGNRKGAARTAVNRFVVFFLTGLWHGAAFNFILWGLGHGLFMTLERLKGKRNPGAATSSLFVRAFKHALTLLEVALLWVLFRNTGIGAIKVIIQMFGLYKPLVSLWGRDFLDMFPSQLIEPYVSHRFIATLFVGAALSTPLYQKLLAAVQKFGPAAQKVFFACKCIFLLGVLVFSVSSLAGGTYNPFIYFRF